MDNDTCFVSTPSSFHSMVGKIAWMNSLSPFFLGEISPKNEKKKVE
jgi:hypothetical protein